MLGITTQDAGAGSGALADLGERRAVTRAMLRATLTSGSLLLIYFVVPVRSSPSASGAALLVLGLAAFTALLTFQIRSITRSRTPRLRAFEAVATSAPLFLLLFAMAYYVMAQGDQSAFSEHLTRLDALYFTVTVFATVGFGDIVAKSETARIAVTVQMVGNLVLIGLGVRMLLSAVQVGLSRQQAGGAPDEPEEPPRPSG